MNNFIDFITLADPNVKYVVFGVTLIAVSSSLVGCFAFLRKRSLVGDAIAHSVLPGVCLAFILFNTKNLLVLLAGATLTGWLALLSIDLIVSKSRIKPDSAIGLVLSVFFGVGILMLTSIQNSGNAGQAGLDRFLFGKAATISQQDVTYFFVISLILIGTVILFYKEFKMIAFDKEFAEAIGMPVKFIEIVLSIITVLAVAVGIQAIGVVLMAAMLITPAAAARYWSDKLIIMILVSIVFAIFAGITGAYISYTAPHMPTGPWIIVIVSIIAFVSIIVAPNRGVLSRYIVRKKNIKKILEENILKTFFHLGEPLLDFTNPRFIGEIVDRRQFNSGELKSGLKNLTRKGKLQKQKNTWQLTDKGLLDAQRIVKLHRLWELYLTKYLKIADDHVHNDAEAIEHVITPEVEAILENMLSYPSEDPHGKQIIYDLKKPPLPDQAE